MKNGEFIFNNTPSQEINSLIQRRPKITAPVRKVRFSSVPGSSGDYILDEKAYNNTSLSLQLFLKGNTEDDVNDLKEQITYIFDSGQYLPLVLYHDLDRVYYVKTTSGPTFYMTGEHPLVVPYEIEFSVKPYKEYAQAFSKTSSSPVVVKNPSLYSSKPKITLYGMGDIDLIVNGKTYPFVNVDGHIVVDSQTQNAYKEVSTGILNHNNKMYSKSFPLLTTGMNEIKAAKNFTSFKVESRWETLVS